jgi:hypothetical protein
MPWIVSEEGLSSGEGALNADEKRLLGAMMPASCGPEDSSQVRTLLNNLQMNMYARVGPTTPEACAQVRQLNGAEVLRGNFVDEPDWGLDDDLPADFDPNGDRAYLGGIKGPTSKTFRHVYYAGWNIAHPILTYQVPTSKVGIAHKRVDILVRAAKNQFANDRLHAYRILAWALHYIEDLSQPFHAVQIPSTQMIPWFALWTLPPGKAMDDLWHETQRSVMNYHWALEGYVRDRMLQPKDNNPFVDCLTNPDYFVMIPDRSSIREPLQLAEALAATSVKLAPAVGSATVGFFGHDLTQRDRDFTKGQPQPNYGELAIRPDLTEKRKAFHDNVCRALANGAWASRWLIKYFLKP